MFANPHVRGLSFTITARVRTDLSLQGNKNLSAGRSLYFIIHQQQMSKEFPQQFGVRSGIPRAIVWDGAWTVTGHPGRKSFPASNLKFSSEKGGLTAVAPDRCRWDSTNNSVKFNWWALKYWHFNSESQIAIIFLFFISSTIASESWETQGSKYKYFGCFWLLVA